MGNITGDLLGMLGRLAERGVGWCGVVCLWLKNCLTCNNSICSYVSYHTEYKYDDDAIEEDICWTVLTSLWLLYNDAFLDSQWIDRKNNYIIIDVHQIALNMFKFCLCNCPYVSSQYTGCTGTDKEVIFLGDFTGTEGGPLTSKDAYSLVSSQPEGTITHVCKWAQHLR